MATPSANIDELAAFKGFSGFNESFDEQCFVLLAQEYAGSLCSMLCDLHGKNLGIDPVRLREAIYHPYVGKGCTGLWQPELGHCVEALKSTELSLASRSVAQLLLALLSQGLPGEWRITLPEARSLRWSNFLLPESRMIDVRSDGSKAAVSLLGGADEQTLEFEALPSGIWNSATLPSLPHVEVGRGHVFLLNQSEVERLGLPGAGPQWIETISSDALKKIARVFDVLHWQFPQVELWISRVLRYLVLQHRPKVLNSGSYDGYFGLVYITLHDDPLKIAEMLIHECCHHYFLLISTVGDLVESEHKNALYYSPFVRRDRPPERILLGYHAFANVERFYRMCVEAGIETEACEHAIRTVAADLAQVEQTVLPAVPLTALGQAMMQPLMEYRSSYAGSN
jgi:HEXXH motif-containing protein